jgi:hypothetical protein
VICDIYILLTELRFVILGQGKVSNCWECSNLLSPRLSHHVLIALPLLIDRLSNEKPSAIFRLRAPQSSVYADSSNASFASHAQGQEDQKAFLGLSLEPLHTLLSLPTPASTASTISNVLVPGGAGPAAANNAAVATSLAPLIAQNLFSYLSSFSSSLSVPEEVIRKWYENFVSRVSRSGIGFLERSGND